MIIITLFCLLLQFNNSDTIRIGLLIQDKQSVAAKQGAELAIREANRIAKNKIIYVLEVRDMEGPWGTGAKESVSLVFDDEVQAVIGCIDGRNSHLAEQVSAKTRVPFISAWSGDPTLGQAFIPWFFSVVPNDEQTASLLLKEMGKNGTGKYLVVSHDDYDSEMAASSFIKKTAALKKNAPEKIRYQDALKELPTIAKKSAGNSIVFFGPASDLSLFMNAGGKSNLIFAPLLLMDERYPEAIAKYKFSDVTVSDPCNTQPGKYKSFSTSYTRTYGIKPGPVSAYSYDAVNLVIEGINQAPDDRSLLFRKIAAIKFSGVTGEISFDEHGSRKNVPVLVKSQDCTFIPVED